MYSNRIKNRIRLAKNLLVLSAMVALVVIIWRTCSKEEESNFQIDDTPLHVESIRTIAEISTVSYKDQVVVDTVEYFKGDLNLYDPLEWERIYKRNIKRRLTLIIEGEVRYGLDLTKSIIKQKQSNDTVFLYLPEPVVLDVMVSPSKTEIFQETGTWSDIARVKLELKAKKLIQQNAEEVHLNEKAKKNLYSVFRKLIADDRKLIIHYE